MKKLINYFLRGVLIVVPLAVTIYLIWAAITFLDGLITLEIPGLGILIILGSITIIGFLGSGFISQQIFDFFEGSLKKAPLVNIIYTAVKDLLNAFVGNKKSFSKPVLIKLYENSEIRRLGFVTNENFKSLGKTEGLITVYVPHSYNISGNLYLVPVSYVQPVDASATDIMKYAISGGVTELGEITPDKIGENNKKG